MLTSFLDNVEHLKQCIDGGASGSDVNTTLVVRKQGDDICLLTITHKTQYKTFQFQLSLEKQTVRDAYLEKLIQSLQQRVLCLEASNKDLQQFKDAHSKPSILFDGIYCQFKQDSSCNSVLYFKPNGTTWSRSVSNNQPVVLPFRIDGEWVLVEDEYLLIRDGGKKT